MQANTILPIGIVAEIFWEENKIFASTTDGGLKASAIK